LPGGYGADTAREVVATICERGLVDFIDMDVGLEPQQFHYGMPTGFTAPHVYRPFVEAVRGAATVPVLSVLGRMTSMADAEAMIAAGVCDMAGATRQLIAEPEFVQNARHGREERSRTCVACNWCMAAQGDNAQGCTINPASYRERLWGVATIAPAAQASRVVIVGGGPGGLEAARISALKGHDVTLIEGRERLGGALALWADLPGRDIWHKAIDWWAAELARLGVDVRLGQSADAASILAECPDAVIVATGARYTVGGRSITFDADIPGHDRPFVYRPEDILLGGARPSGKVILLDAEGINTSAGIAEILGNAGAQVSYVTEGFSPLSPRVTDSFEGRFLMQRMKAAGVRFIPSSWARSIGEGTVTLYDLHTGEERTEAADAVVLACGRVPHDEISRDLAGEVAQLFVIGDAMGVRPLAAASYEGQRFARLIGEPGAPATISESFFRPDDPVVNPLPADMARR
ncbi:MAG: hypothetical protein EOP61_26315, partial [Sphingomonadales bacterium]